MRERDRATIRSERGRRAYYSKKEKVREIEGNLGSAPDRKGEEKRREGSEAGRRT